MKFSLVGALIGRFEWLNLDGGDAERRVSICLRLDEGLAF
jgi:hypothetical protein